MESRFRYQVTPYSPIKDLIPGQSLRRAFTSDLTKEEVLLCMKHGPVARLFPGKLPIRVTGSNLDSLHKKQFEGDFIDMTSKYTGSEKKDVIDTPKVPEESKTEPPTEVNSVENTESTESVAENTEVVDSTPDKVPEVDITEEAPSEEVDTEVESKESEDAEDDDEGETLSVEDNTQPVNASNNNNNQYHNKKKKRH